MFYAVVKPATGSLQSVHENSTLADEIPILHLDSAHEDPNPGEHRQRSGYWHKGVSRILVEKRELNAGASWLPEALIYEPEPNHTAIWDKRI
jgi:hypothetical protein